MLLLLLDICVSCQKIIYNPFINITNTFSFHVRAEEKYWCMLNTKAESFVLLTLKSPVWDI